MPGTALAVPDPDHRAEQKEQELSSSLPEGGAGRAPKTKGEAQAPKLTPETDRKQNPAIPPGLHR